MADANLFDVPAFFEETKNKEKMYRREDGECWREIGYPNFRKSAVPSAWRYASDQGRLLSGDLRILSSKPEKGYVATTLPILKIGTHGAMAHTSLHRIVAFTFLDPPPLDGQEYTVDHINRNKDDNRMLNLKWALAYEQLNNREINHYTLQIADGRTFCSVAAFAKEFHTSETMIRENLRQTAEGDVVVVGGVEVCVQRVQRKAMRDVSDHSLLHKYGGKKKGLKQRDVALGMFIGGKTVVETSQSMDLKVDTVFSYLATAARESTRPILAKLAERIGVSCPLVRQQLQADIVAFNASFKLHRDQSNPGEYDLGYQGIVLNRLPAMAEDWRVIRGVFQAIHHILP